MKANLVLAIPVVALAVATTSLLADTIHLKNGMSIVANKAEEKDGQVEYWVAGTKYSIAKESVVRIEAGDAAPDNRQAGPWNGETPTVIDLSPKEGTSSPPPTHDKLELTLPAGPAQSQGYWAGLLKRITVGDAIDDMRLAEIETEHNTRTTADAFYLAGVVKMKEGNSGKASGYFEHAIQAMPQRIELLEWHAIALSAQGKYPEAANELDHAAALQPNSAVLLRLLGQARYDADRTSDAVTAWKRSMELSPDPETARLIQKAERELKVEDQSRRKESRHFTLHYDGEKTSAEVQQELLGALENDFRELSDQLSYEPAENIIVILYTRKEFEDITQAPTWAGALNDGKLRIPIGGVTALTPDLGRVLRHELTHSFLNSLARGRCPVWLNEGLAQMMEPRSSGMYAQELARLFQVRKEIPFTVLEHPFMRFSPLQAEVAYAESLSAVEYLRDRYRMGEIVRMLQNIGSGVEAEQALRNSTGMDYVELQQRMGQYLASASR
jgi:tetratricopeptide (TPR) repeat protein